MTSIPLSDAGLLRPAANRTLVVRATLGGALVALVIAFALVSRHPGTQTIVTLPAHSSAIVVLDVSASISADTYARIGATLMDQPCPYDVVIDRISHEVPFYRTWLKKALLDGATVVNLSPAVAQDLNIDPFAGRGVLVTKIGQGFALNAGLRPGDFVREVNGRAINTTADLAAVSNAGAATWTVTIERNGQRITARLRA